MKPVVTAMKPYRFFSSYILPFSFVLVLSFSVEAFAEDHEKFLQCLSLQSDTIAELIYTPKNSSYSSVLESKIQNLVFSTATNPKPQFIITPFRVSEIQAAIKCSKKYGLQIRVRSGGHDHGGLSSVSDVPFIIVDLINFSEIKVDAEEKTAWVQSGATIGELNYRISEKNKNLAYPVGTCPTVGVGGHFSGGGYGALLRKHGIAADHVIDAHIIDVNGIFLNRKSMGEDLFWAIRGGGGSFGIIIEWKVNLVSVPSTVTVFNVVRTIEQNAIKLIHKWQFIADRVDEDLFIQPILQRVNSSTVALFPSLFLGGADRLLPLMHESFPELGLTKEDCREMSFVESCVFFNGFEVIESIDVNILLQRDFKTFFKGKVDYVTELVPEKALEGILEIFSKEDPQTNGLVVFFPYGGKMSEISESEIPFPHRAGNIYSILYYVAWKEAENTESTYQKHYNLLKKLFNYMTPYVTKNPRTAYINYRDLDIGTNNKGNLITSVEEASAWGIKYFKHNFYKLVHVKTKVDPENFFRNEQSIPPALNLVKDEL